MSDFTQGFGDDRFDKFKTACEEVGVSCSYITEFDDAIIRDFGKHKKSYLKLYIMYQDWRIDMLSRGWTREEVYEKLRVLLN